MVFYDNILNRAQTKMWQRGKECPGKDGKLYKGLKVTYILSLSFATIWSLMLILGLAIFWNEIVATGRFSSVDFSVILGCTVLMPFSLFSLKIKNEIVSASIFGGANLGFATTLIFYFAKFLKDDTVVGGLSVNFYWCHLAPLVIAAICAAGMSIIIINAFLKIKEAYNNVLESVYDEYNKLPADEKTEWEEFVKNYKFGKK